MRTRVGSVLVVLVIGTSVQGGPVVVQAADHVPTLPASYAGTLTGTLAFSQDCDLDGVAEPVRVRALEQPVSLDLTLPASDGVETEPSPFNLLLGPLDDDGVGQAGEVWLRSATVVLTPETARQALLRYWDLTLVAGILAGTLVDSQRQAAAVMNLVWDEEELVPCRTGLPMVLPFPLLEGATLDGWLDADRLDLGLHGVTTDGSRELNARISAQAVATPQG